VRRSGRKREKRPKCRLAPGESFGAISQRPLSVFPSRAAKRAAESKRGQHSQSIEPSRPTRAAVLAIAYQRIVFDAKRHRISLAWSAIGAAVTDFGMDIISSNVSAACRDSMITAPF
jgi:hypothetical protein